MRGRYTMERGSSTYTWYDNRRKYNVSEYLINKMAILIYNIYIYNYFKPQLVQNYK